MTSAAAADVWVALAAGLILWGLHRYQAMGTRMRALFAGACLAVIGVRCWQSAACWPATRRIRSYGWFFIALAIDWFVVTGICYRLMLRERADLAMRA